MSGLRWGRLDVTWPRHPKFLALLSRRQWQTVVVYWAALAYSIEQGTDGHVEPEVLAALPARPRDAERLVEVGLWEIPDDKSGWMIHNFAERQQSSATTELRKELGRQSANKRWHPD